MRSAEAALWFNNVSLDGWDGANWVPGIALGDFHSFDRFITERTFGAKKRMFLCPQSTSFDATVYPVVRTADGVEWIIVSDNHDIEYDELYQRTYTFLETNAKADVIEFQEQTSSSGAPIGIEEVVIGTYHCDIERYSSSRSDEVGGVVYGHFEITLPDNQVAGGEHELLIDGIYYQIREIVPELLTKVCRCVKRG